MADAAHADPQLRRDPGRWLVAAALAVLLAIALGWHPVAQTSYNSAASGGTSVDVLSARAAAAQRAAWMEPWSAAYARRALTLREWARGAELLSAGDYNGAVDALAIAYRNDVGNAALLALFRQAQDAQALASNKKAHLQHGHEGPGGTLRPQDVER